TGLNVGLHLLLLREPRGGDERLLHVLEAGEDRLAIGLHELALARLGDGLLTAQATAVEDRLQQRRGDPDRGGRAARDEREQRAAGQAGRSRELDGRQQRRARGGDVGVGRGELGLGAGQVRTAYEEVRGQAGIDRRHGEIDDARPLHVEAFRRPADQARERGERVALERLGG